VFWDVTPCSPVQVHLRFAFILRVERSVKRVTTTSCIFYKSLPGSLTRYFDPENGNNKFLRNVRTFTGQHSATYQKTIRLTKNIFKYFDIFLLTY
jgi:hypothetical protein